MQIVVHEYKSPLTLLEIVRELKETHKEDGIALFGIELVEQEFLQRNVT